MVPWGDKQVPAQAHGVWASPHGQAHPGVGKGGSGCRLLSFLHTLGMVGGSFGEESKLLRGGGAGKTPKCDQGTSEWQEG